MKFCMENENISLAKWKGACPCIPEPQKLGLAKGIYVKRCAPFDSVMPVGGWSDTFFISGPGQF